MFRQCGLLPAKGNGWFNTFRFIHKNYYKVLELEKNCTTKDIRNSFLTLSKRYHPDKCNDKDSHRKFQDIMEAYTVLSKPSSRMDHDFTLRCNDQSYSQPYRTVRYEYGYDPRSTYHDSYGGRERMFYKDYYENYNKKENGGNGKNIDKKLMLIICGFILTAGAYLQYIGIRAMYAKIQILRRRSDMRNAAHLQKSESEAEGLSREQQLKNMMDKHRANQGANSS